MILPEQDLAHVAKHVCVWCELGGKRIFLSGASGFVGTWLKESFEFATGAQLITVARDSFPDGDFDFGIHAAKSDLNGTRRILDFAAERNVMRLLFTSSGAVYGRFPPGMNHVTEDFACSPETDYARNKLAGESLCAQYGFCSVIARMFAFVGPALPLDANFAVGNFVRDVMEGSTVLVQGDGTSRRSYLYAADLAIWLWTLLVEGGSGRPYNVGSSDAVSISELARLVVANTKPCHPLKVLGRGGSDIYVPCVERARTELRLQPLISLEEGIRRMYAWNLEAKEEKWSLLPLLPHKAMDKTFG